MVFFANLDWKLASAQKTFLDGHSTAFQNSWISAGLIECRSKRLQRAFFKGGNVQVIHPLLFL
ncbi:MAG: hypothetical protein ACQET7_07815 [Thermodesulfobacteriota bacterium]